MNKMKRDKFVTYMVQLTSTMQTIYNNNNNNNNIIIIIINY